MTDQKRNYLPKNQTGLYVIGKRFFDRPLKISDLLDRAEGTGEWPENGETVEILRRLADLQTILWDRRYQPFENLKEFIVEASELSVKLTEVETEHTAAGLKCQNVSATVSFTGLMNVWMITVSTRGLKEYNKKPWGDEARKVLKNLPVKVRKVVLLPEDDPIEKELVRKVSLGDCFEVENSSREGEPGKKVRKLEISKEVHQEKKEWRKDLKDLEIDLVLKMEKRCGLVDQKFRDFQKAQSEISKVKDELIRSMQVDLKKLKLFMSKQVDLDSSSEGALAIDESVVPAEKAKVIEVAQAAAKTVLTKPKVVPTKDKVVPTKVESVTKVLKKRIKKTGSLLSVMSRPGYSGEGDKDKLVSSKPRIVIEPAIEIKMNDSDRIPRISVENPKKGLGLSSKEARSFEFSSDSLPGLDQIGTQQSDVNEPLLDEIMGEGLEISEFEREETLDMIRLDKVNREVIEEEKRAKQRAKNDRARVVKKEKLEKIQRELIGKVEKRNSKKPNVKDRLGAPIRKRK